MKGLYLLAAIVAVTVLGCNEYKKKTDIEKRDSIAVVTEAKKDKAVTADFYGTYQGTLPCADCSGIKTTLKINGDTTYELRSEYLDKDDAVFEESGVYRVVGEDVIELVTPSSGDRTYYKIIDGAVVMSDSTGMIDRGELADYYVLKRMVSTPAGSQK